MVETAQPTSTRPDNPAGNKQKARAVGVAVGLTLAALIFSGIFGALAMVPLFLLGFTLESTVTFVFLLVGSQIGFLAVGYLYTRRYALSVPIERPTRRGLKYAAGGILAALSFATAASVVLTSLGLAPESVLEEFVVQDPTIALWMALLSVFVVAPVEEYLFRGVIQGRLRGAFGAPAAIVTASLLFGSLHFGNYVGTFGTVVGWALLISGVGLIFGILYERTDNLAVPILAHAVYNVVLFVTGYLML
ncbi:lysostaphin resistance A-like protein (plasmid) [Haloferacaceae archaeon DSL9]